MNRENRVDLKGTHQGSGETTGKTRQRNEDEEYKLQSVKDMGERGKAESIFGIGKRIYNADNMRAKLPDTADAWTAACFLAKNVMKSLKGLPWLVFEKNIN